mgnify:CR=1 FL=1
MATPSSFQTVTLGPKGPEVPALGVGTWAWGDALFWQYGGAYGADDIRAAFNTSVSTGVNFFDTAEVYGLGKSEELIGQFMQQSDQTAVVATKYMPVPWRFSAQSVADALTASLKRLKLPAITLYQVHWPERNSNFFGKLGYQHQPDEQSIPVEETLDALNELVDEGKIRTCCYLAVLPNVLALSS